LVKPRVNFTFTGTASLPLLTWTTEWRRRRRRQKMNNKKKIEEFISLRRLVQGQSKLSSWKENEVSLKRIYFLCGFLRKSGETEW
jgi:hypothetical protein